MSLVGGKGGSPLPHHQPLTPGDSEVACVGEKGEDLCCAQSSALRPSGLLYPATELRLTTCSKVDTPSATLGSPHPGRGMELSLIELGLLAYLKKNY